MILKKDISNRIHSDFKKSSNEATEILQKGVSKTDYLKSDRVIRCILFSADGNLTKLKQNIEYAIIDWRDVVFWAEYSNLEGNKTPKRIRDFNRTFKDCEIN